MPKQILLVDDSVTIQRVVELTFAHERLQGHCAPRAPMKGCRRRASSGRTSCWPTPACAGKSGYDLCASLRSESGARVGAVPDPDRQLRALRRRRAAQVGRRRLRGQAVRDAGAHRQGRRRHQPQGRRVGGRAGAPLGAADRAAARRRAVANDAQGRQPRDFDRRRQVGADAGAGRRSADLRRRVRLAARRLRPPSSRRRRRRPRAR